MADSQPKPQPQPPSIGRIVVFRNGEGADMPAIITAILDADAGAVHLTAFPAPGIAPPQPSYQYGYLQVPEGVDAADPEQGWQVRGRWRWPERT